jgi:hypothetical protein
VALVSDRRHASRQIDADRQEGAMALDLHQATLVFGIVGQAAFGIFSVRRIRYLRLQRRRKAQQHQGYVERSLAHCRAPPLAPRGLLATESLKGRE